MTAPAYIKTPFFGGPCDGDRRRVENRNALVCFDSACIDELHCYAWSEARQHMEYIGLMYDGNYRGPVLPLSVGQER